MLEEVGVTERRKRCSHWFPEKQEFCGEPGMLYPNGIRCDEHAPWKVAGQMDPREQVKIPPARSSSPEPES